MAPKAQSRLTQSLAENAALLSLLTKAPAAAQSNPRPAIVNPDPTRLLSFERESSLANTFAFLSGISDYPSDVVAACVEELPGGNGIRVVVAINKLHAESGCNVLARIKDGLDEIFRRLAQLRAAVSEAGPTAEEDAILQDQVLDAIVVMCTNRILGRINSRRSDAVYFKKGKLFLGSTVQQTVDAVRHHAWDKKSRPKSERFINGATLLLERLEELERCQQKDVLSCIKRVLRAAHRLNTTNDFDKLFPELTASELNPTTKTGFESRLGKLAMYQQCSLYLSKMAKESALFDSLVVTCVSLDSPLFTRNVTTVEEACLNNCLFRCRGGSKLLSDPKALNTKLKTNKAEFRSTVQKLIKESRVHAEVQIVCYYELHPIVKKPRVICSSKDACYLCNLFIRLHGTYHIPRTHGNLYPGWRMLPIPALEPVQAKLNRSLEIRIAELIRRVDDAANKEVTCQNANESSVFPFPVLLPALASSTLLARVQEMNDASQHPQKEHSRAPEASPNPRSQTLPTGPSNSVVPALQASDADPPPTEQVQTATAELPGAGSFHGCEGSHESKHDTDKEAAEKTVEEQGELPSVPPQTPNPTGGDAPGIDFELGLQPEKVQGSGCEDRCQPKADQEQEPEQELDPNPIPPTPTPTPESATPTSSLSPPTRVVHLPPQIVLARGQVFSLPVNHAAVETLPCLTAGSITIYPDHFRGPVRDTRPASSSRSQIVEMQIQWLPPERAAAFRVARPRGFMALDGHSKGVDLDGGSAECVYLANGEDVAMVELVRGKERLTMESGAA
ncbi:hypothetical protein VTK26DRAFT_6920 [Humicola hyalothermophila]